MFFMPKTRSKPEPEPEWFGSGPPNRPWRLQCTRSLERLDGYNVTYLCGIFTSPSSALTPMKRVTRKHKPKSTKSRLSNPMGLHMQQLWSVHCFLTIFVVWFSKTRQAISSSDWVSKDLHFDYRTFMDRILELFKDPELRWVKNTLAWWNE